VTLTAAITTSPAGAQYLPTLSFGSSGTVSITGSAGQTATLSVSTTAATAGAVTDPMHRRVPWQGAGVLACVLLFGMPRRGRRQFAKLAMLGFAILLTGGMLACGGGGSGSGSGSGSGGTSTPGTTAGTYVVTVTCISGSTSLSTGTLTLRVQ
jgi:hypothetical protein